MMSNSTSGPQRYDESGAVEYLDELNGEMDFPDDLRGCLPHRHDRINRHPRAVCWRTAVLRIPGVVWWTCSAMSGMGVRRRERTPTTKPSTRWPPFVGGGGRRGDGSLESAGGR